MFIHTIDFPFKKKHTIDLNFFGTIDITMMIITNPLDTGIFMVSTNKI